LLRQADRGIADVCGQGAAGIGVLEQEGHGIADKHLIPDADAHRSAFFRVNRLAAQILLVGPHVEDVNAAEPANNGRFQSKLEEEYVQPRVVDHRYHFAEQDIYVAGTLLHNGVEPEETQQPESRGHQAEAREECCSRRY